MYNIYVEHYVEHTSRLKIVRAVATIRGTEMPFGPYKSHTDCVRKVSHKKNPPKDPHAYCKWIEDKITKGDELLLELIKTYKSGDVLRAAVQTYYRLDTAW
jgi:hypothetical protein